MSERSRSFDELMSRVQACRLCPRMDDSLRVLSWANGSPDAPLMFVGEAPGRLGADRTAIPFHGDKSGDNFERLLELAGLRRSEVFVTNAVLCNPRDDAGNNAAPSRGEIERCALHLKSQIDLIQPKMVMTLGSVALLATQHIEAHSLTLSGSVRTSNAWYGRRLLPLYHPGARAMIHRSFANQTADYYFVGETYRRLNLKPRTQTKARGAQEDWSIVIDVIRKSQRPITNFQLHKIMYLVDLKSMETLGRRVTNFLYLRQKDGPYCVELGSKWYSQYASEVVANSTTKALTFSYRAQSLFEHDDSVQLDVRVASLIDEVLKSVENLDDGQLKTRVYLSKPMRNVLRAEKLGERMLNRPLLS